MSQPLDRGPNAPGALSEVYRIGSSVNRPAKPVTANLQSPLTGKKPGGAEEWRSTSGELPVSASPRREAVPGNTELHVHFEGLSYIDHACIDLLLNWEKVHTATGGSLVIDWDSLTARFHQPRNGSDRSSDGPHVTTATNGSSTRNEYVAVS